MKKTMLPIPQIVLPLKGINKILLITTEGCEGCTIMKHNLEYACKQVSRSFEVGIYDRFDVLSTVLKRYGVTDFPTLLMFSKGELLHKYTGTMPIPVIVRWIDIYFK